MFRDGDRWLEQFERVKLFNQWDTKKKFREVSSALKAFAEAWLENGKRAYIQKAISATASENILYYRKLTSCAAFKAVGESETPKL